MKLSVDAEILKLFVEGKRLFVQYKEGNWERKAYISKHFDELIKLMRNHAMLTSRSTQL